MPNILRKPEWLKIKLPDANVFSGMNENLKNKKLNTICQSGNCPNIGECWKSGTATFMILGDICTRNCRFCAVKTGNPLPEDWLEPSRVAEMISLLDLKHCVLTSVTRDDLPDGGATLWAETVKQIRKINPDITIETLIPDFNGDISSLKKVTDVKPEIISHNLETVERLTKTVRIKASYKISLEVLKNISLSGCTAKSGIMVGLGETDDEIFKTMDDLLNVGCKIMTIGQYLQPTKEHLPLVEYITPEKFDYYKKIAVQKGFNYIESAPLVRSSYHAEKQVVNKF
ncbi:MAG: lipoyl synthase [Bacteroidota bacterium]|nr:lipoyl synthase [Bacteroidota bacterium]